MLDSMAYEVNKIISTYRELTIKVEKKATYTQRTIIKGMIFKNHMRKEKKSVSEYWTNKKEFCHSKIMTLLPVGRSFHCFADIKFLSCMFLIDHSNLISVQSPRSRCTLAKPVLYCISSLFCSFLPSRFCLSSVSLKGPVKISLPPRIHSAYLRWVLVKHVSFLFGTQ